MNMTSVVISKLRTEFFKQPLGSLPKRELELLVLKLLIEGGELDANPVKLAKAGRITLLKAYSYLTDIALRDDPITDVEAENLLIELIRTSEVMSDGVFLQLSVQDARLRIWIENRLSESQLLAGESLRRDTAKLSGRALAVLLSGSNVLPSPKKAVSKLKKEFGDELWFQELKSSSESSSDWSVILQSVIPAAKAIKVLMSS
jgi:hypothetical protein